MKNVTRSGNIIGIKDAYVFASNFDGHPEGNFQSTSRYIRVKLPDAKVARDLIDDGWPVTVLPPKGNHTDPLYLIKGLIRFNQYPPTIYMVSKDRKTRLNDNTLAVLESSYIDHVDVIMSFNMKRNCLYVRELYAHIEEPKEYLSFKNDYANIPSDGDDQVDIIFF